MDPGSSVLPIFSHVNQSIGQTSQDTLQRNRSPSGFGVVRGGSRNASPLSQAEVDEADPDVIPNQFGTRITIRLLLIFFVTNNMSLFLRLHLLLLRTENHESSLCNAIVQQHP